jgi:hypothetical protein
VAGNTVYIGANGFGDWSFPSFVAMLQMENNKVNPPFEFIREDGSNFGLVPCASPCSLQKYLAYCTGFKDGIKD